MWALAPNPCYGCNTGPQNISSGAKVFEVVRNIPRAQFAFCGLGVADDEDTVNFPMNVRVFVFINVVFLATSRGINTGTDDSGTMEDPLVATLSPL